MDRRERLRALVNEALSIPRERWPAYLDGACAGDDELRREALRNLSEASQLGSFLGQASRSDTRAVDLDRTRTLAPPTAPSPAPASTVDTSAGAPPADRAADSRPTYELLEVLGQGGFGIVFRANQLTPVRRPVAIKYLRPEREGVVHGLRFEAERQALASLSHPGIAKLLDAGQTPDGRLYFSMEYVAGEPIDSFSDRGRLAIGARLALFLQVCEAIQHAHFRGIIHRDLKPANILAFEQDGVPVVRVIDLGLALATEAPLLEGGRLLQEGAGAGTPTHMSPEQWSRLPHEIDTRTDVYSLGVVLHELLIGVLPIRWSGRGGLEEFGRALLGERPPPPSEGYRALPPSERAEIAAARGTDPRGLERELDSDLDAIVARALAKDPAERYPSPGALAAEIRRSLAHEPVEAHASTLAYRTRKFIRRNRIAVTAAAAIALTAAIGLGTTTAYRAVAREERALSRLLSDLETLTGAPERLETLWPLGPAVIAPLEALRGQLAEVASRGERYEAFLVELEEQLAEGDDTTRRWTRFQAENVAAILAILREIHVDDGRERYADLADLAAPPERPRRGLLAEVDWRLGRARTLDELTRSGPGARAAWAEAARALSESPRYAGMAPFEPQLGLLPLGFDPRSGLAEFWHVPSGARPVRDEQGSIRVRPEDGIVLVLIPGGSYDIGCETPLGFAVEERDGAVVVQAVLPGTLAAAAGIAKDDRLLAIDGEPVAGAGALAELERALLVAGKSLLLEFLTAEGSTVSRRLDLPPPGPGRILDPWARAAESPTTTVRLDPYFIGKYEMTQAQWARWTGRNPSTNRAGIAHHGRVHTSDQPVESIAWDEARRVCGQMGLALPTEARWEAACRAGTTTPWCAGERVADLQGHANVSDRTVAAAGIGGWAIETELDDGFALTAPVGAFAPNPFGLHGTIGNLWEWCEEVAISYGSAEHPFSPGDGSRPPIDDSPNRVIRGGGYSNLAEFARSARRWNYRTAGDQDVGVRPARSLDGGSPPP